MSLTASPCVGSNQTNGAIKLNAVGFQVCAAGDAIVCPIVNLFFAPPKGQPDFDGTKLTCADIDANVTNYAPRDAGTHATPGVCEVLPGEQNV
jgi:hypothetical protein